MLFMSREHVDAMNELIEKSDEVRQAGLALDRDYTMAYHLTRGDGTIEGWSMTGGPTGFAFGLGERPDADVILTGSYELMIEATKASRAGEVIDPQITIEGDLEAMAKVSTVMETARPVATIDVDFPTLP